MAADAGRDDVGAADAGYPDAGCALCGADDGVPVGVGANFADPADRASYLVLRCRACGLLYLDPRPGAAPADADAAPAGRQSADRQSAGRESARGDVVLADALERCADPVGALARAAAALGPGGRVVVRVANAGGAAARLFAGRHWAGYEFPRRRQFFTAATLGAAAERAGLRVERVAVRGDGRAWARSLGHLLADLGGPAHPAGRARAPGRLLVALGAALDAIPALAGRGGRLEATLRPE